MNAILKISFTLASVIIGIGISTTALASEIADIIYHNGTILTINDAQPRAEAVAVKNGKILTVGAEKDIFKSKGDATD